MVLLIPLLSVLVSKALNTVETVFNKRSLLLDENGLLSKKNSKAINQKSIKPQVIAAGKGLSYKDMITAKQGHNIKEVGEQGSKGGRQAKRTIPTAGGVLAKCQMEVWNAFIQERLISLSEMKIYYP